MTRNETQANRALAERADRRAMLLKQARSMRRTQNVYSYALQPATMVHYVFAVLALLIVVI